MNTNASPSAINRFLFGCSIFTCVVGFAVPFGIMVLKTDKKEASFYDSTQSSIVHDIVNTSNESEQTIDLITTEESNLSQSTNSGTQTSAYEQSFWKSPFKMLWTSVSEPIVDLLVESAEALTKGRNHDLEGDLVFDESFKDNDLVIDSSLFALKVNSAPTEKVEVETKISNMESPKGGASRKSGKYSPKGSLHQMALVSKNPTVVIGLDPRTPEVIIGKEGSRITIPAGSLVFDDGTPCNAPYDAKVWEFYDFSDILLSGLTTMSNQGPLRTGGMTYVEVTSKGRKLNLSDGSKARISFAPFYKTDSDFGLYNGTLADKQILWRKVEQKQENQAIDRSRISVSTFPESLQKLSHFGNLVCLLNRGYLIGETKVFGSEIHKESFTGKGLARFPNGAAILFDGHLEISKYDQHVGGSVNRCNLETRFEGTRLLAYFPVSNPKSSFKVFLPQEGFPVPFITTKDFRKSSLLSYRKGAETSIDALHGELNFLSTKKRVFLSEQSFIYEDRIGRGSVGKVSHLSSVFSTRDILGDFEGKDYSVMEQLNTLALTKGKSFAQKIAQRQATQTMVFTNFNRGNFPINPSANFFVNRLSGNQSNFGSEFSLWTDLLEHLDELQIIAVSTSDREAAEKIRQTRNDLHQIADDAGIAIQANIEANLNFRREFLSPRLGWHNLDALRVRGNSEIYELASNELQLSSSLEETNSSISMGPFYFSVWPQERISLVAGPGKNSIPRGAFTSMGYFLSEDGRLFADVATGTTGKIISLNLREMNKENFRKKVKGFL